jgi:hypothetical protein
MNSSHNQRETVEILRLMREALAPLASMCGSLLAGNSAREKPDTGHTWFTNVLPSAPEQEAVKTASEAELPAGILRGRVGPS